MYTFWGKKGCTLYSICKIYYLPIKILFLFEWNLISQWTEAWNLRENISKTKQFSLFSFWILKTYKNQ